MEKMIATGQLKKKTNLTVYSSHVTNAFIQATPYLLRIEILRRVNIFQIWETN